MRSSLIVMLAIAMPCAAALADPVPPRVLAKMQKLAKEPEGTKTMGGIIRPLTTTVVWHNPDGSTHVKILETMLSKAVRGAGRAEESTLTIAPDGKQTATHEAMPLFEWQERNRAAGEDGSDE
jgi:hypothetical protein